MENTRTWLDTGLSTEQLVAVTKELIYQLFNGIDIKGAVLRTKKKFPDIQEDQWNKILNYEDSYPDMSKPDWVEEMDNELGLTALLTSVFTPGDGDLKPEPVC